MFVRELHRDSPTREAEQVNENTIAGYRTIRSLKENAESQTILVRASAHAGEEALAELKTVKRFEAGAAVSRILSEIECGVRAQGESVCLVEDIAAAPDGSPVIVSSWQSGGTLRRLLREREALRPGEAITILAPLSAALGRVHRAGVVLGVITPDSIHFDAAGRPFFAEWEHARSRETSPTPKDLRWDSAFQADRLHFATLACGVLAAVRADREIERRAAALTEWLSDIEQSSSSVWELDWERKLFELGAPEPVRLDLERESPPAHSEPVLFDRSALVTPLPDGAKSEWGAVFALPPVIQRSVGETAHRIRGFFDGVVGAARRWCAPVRKRTWVIAAAGALALGLAAAMLLTDDADAGADASAEAINALSAPDSGSDTPDVSAAGAEPSSDGESAAAPEIGATSGAGGLAEDPLEALPTLLATRADCLRDLSVKCLGAVSRSESPAFAADSAVISAVLEGAELSSDALFDAARAVEVQRLGDSVLFEFESPGDESEPASLLLVKGEAGWRIRSYTLPR